MADRPAAVRIALAGRHAAACLRALAADGGTTLAVLRRSGHLCHDRSEAIVGIGPSGPQVIEGWHGVAYGKPHGRLREYVSIVRKIVAREEPVVHEGAHYALPYRGPDATGLGKPLKSILHGNPALRIFTGAFTENGLRTAAEVADGVFPVWMNPDRFDLFEAALRDGFGRAANTSFSMAVGRRVRARARASSMAATSAAQAGVDGSWAWRLRKCSRKLAASG